ncbi:MAG: SCO family protein [Gammaproteobacteria bacterium]|nr:SCO family protein [Gammaproteobacteria bacterium]
MIVATGAGVWLGLRTNDRAIQTDDLSATVLSPAKQLSSFSLIDHHGQDFTLENLKGRWSWLFFGYTSCPDVCPNTMSLLDTVVGKIAQRHSKEHQVVFVSVDPERDTIKVLSKYVPYFNESFVGVTGETDELNKFADELGILRVKIEADQGSGYLVDHTASILLINPLGQLQALFSPPHDVLKLVNDFGKITDQIKL